MKSGLSRTEERRLIGLSTEFFFVLHANFAKFKSAYLLLIFLHTKQSWPSDLSMINGLDPSEDQQNHSKFPTHKRKSHKISLHSSDSQRCRTANPHLTSNHNKKFPLPQALAGYPPSASRDPQPSSFSLLNRSDISLCFTFLCSLVSTSDSKSLFSFETLDFNPTLQVSNRTNTKPCWFSSSHVSSLSRGSECCRWSVTPRAPSAASQPLSTTTAVSLSSSTGSCRSNKSVLSLFY